MRARAQHSTSDIECVRERLCGGGRRTPSHSPFGRINHRISRNTTAVIIAVARAAHPNAFNHNACDRAKRTAFALANGRQSERCPSSESVTGTGASNRDSPPITSVDIEAAHHIAHALSGSIDRSIRTESYARARARLIQITRKQSDAHARRRLSGRADSSHRIGSHQIVSLRLHARVICAHSYRIASDRDRSIVSDRCGRSRFTTRLDNGRFAGRRRGEGKRNCEDPTQQ
jgi:hypothetical protein